MKNTLNARKSVSKLALCVLMLVFFVSLTGCPKITPTESNVVYHTVKFVTGVENVSFNDIKVEEGNIIPNFDEYTIEDTEDAVFAGWTFNGVPFAPEAKITSDMTLVARWEVEVVLKAGEGAFENGEQELTVKIERGSKLSSKEYVPVSLVGKDVVKQERHSFAYWKDSSESEFDFNAGIDRHITLYAHYNISKYYVVTFNAKDLGTDFTVEVDEGKALENLPVLENEKYHFEYWYNDSYNNKYDVSAVVTSNITLNARWTVKLDSIKKFENGYVEFTLADSVSSSTFVEAYSLTINNVVYTTGFDYSNLSKGVISFVFNEIEPSETNKTIEVVVTDGKKSISDSFTVFAFLPPSNIKFSQDGKIGTISWNKYLDYENYFIKYYALNDSTNVVEKEVTGSSYSFDNLEYFTDYVFEVATIRVNSKKEKKYSNSNLIGISLKNNSDYLILMYMDGDNNLNDPIFADMNEVEKGLSMIRNEDGSSKSGYASVNVVALWDGFAGDAKTTPLYGDSGSFLYELGADYRATKEADVTLGDATKNISYIAEWLKDGEVNMGDRNTLVNFYKTVMKYYNADHIILQYSNHGGGTRAANGFTVVDKYGIEHTYTQGERRSMCWDDNSPKSYLKSKDVPLALTEAGMPMVDLIIEDVCLGGNIEEAYELRNSAKYLLASANNIPGSGLNYVDLISSFKTSSDILKIGKDAVSSYKAQYTLPLSVWNSIDAQNSSNSQYSALSPLNKSEAFCSDLSTIAMFDLSKVGSVVEKLNILVTELKDNGSKHPIRIDSTTVISADIFLAMFITRAGNYGIDNAARIDYMGTFVWETDLYYMMDCIKKVEDSVINWPSLWLRADDVIKALNNVVVYSWKDGYKKPLYEKGLGYTSISGNVPAGLTISTGLVNLSVKGDETIIGIPYNPNWYENDLQFGKDCKWNELLTKWFGLVEDNR